jgi:hypothetical protein
MEAVVVQVSALGQSWLNVSPKVKNNNVSIEGKP